MNTEARGLVTHRRRKRHRPPVDRYVLEHVRAAVAAPLVIVLAVLGAALIAWSTVQVPTGHLLAAVACGLVAAVVVGVQRARAVAVAVERVREEGLRKVTEAVAAVGKSVLWTAEELCRGGTPAMPGSAPLQERAGPANEAVALLDEVQVQAVAALVRVHDESQSAVLVSMLHQLSRREHALIDRALKLLDELQDLTEDPDLLDSLYKLDHLVTRMRRWVESKAVLAGESLRSAWQPVSVTEVLRGAVQEVLHYSRVSTAAGTVGVELGLPRHVGPDLTHLLAELVDNATQFSNPVSKVRVRARQVATGLVVEVEDEVAIPMRAAQREQLNLLLADPGQVDVSAQVREGRIGLLTAAKIGRRHGISVRLMESPTGGTTAQVVVPAKLLVQMTAPEDSSGPAAALAPPPAAPSSRSSVLVGATPSTPPAGAPPAPADAGTAPAAGAPPLPRRVLEHLDVPEPTRPAAPVTGPRYDLAGAFRGGINAARGQDGHAPTDGPEAPKPPAAQP
ncbi:ATP-binding protein [Streptomyces sp. NPDC057617]|uniref:ATP-binding protein n=1 Tax=unclassified Streptomyces TaxID=2593676 RepID=UPI00369F3327